MHFVIPLDPVAKGRPRVRLQGGRAMAYTPQKTARAQDAMRLSIETQLPDDWRPLTGPVDMVVEVYVRMPGRIPKRDHATARPCVQPDVDNYVKLAMDACGALWSNDGQVVDVHASKHYSERPRWEIWVRSAAG